MKIKLLFIPFILLFFSCDNPLLNNNDINCIVDSSGFFDECGICSGGTTGRIANSSLDCCNGSVIDGVCVLACEEVLLDECDICSGANTQLDYCNI